MQPAIRPRQSATDSRPLGNKCCSEERSQLLPRSTRLACCGLIGSIECTADSYPLKWDFRWPRCRPGAFKKRKHLRGDCRCDSDMGLGARLEIARQIRRTDR